MSTKALEAKKGGPANMLRRRFFCLGTSVKVSWIAGEFLQDGFLSFLRIAAKLCALQSTLDGFLVFALVFQVLSSGFLDVWCFGFLAEFRSVLRIFKVSLGFLRAVAFFGCLGTAQCEDTEGLMAGVLAMRRLRTGFSPSG